MTLWHLARAVAETARISVPTLIEGLTGKLTPEVCDERLQLWSRRLLLQAGVILRVEGLERAPADETFVVMSNHQSHYDIPVMFQALQRRVRMVAKAELFKIPGWGPAMTMAGFVEVDRKDRVAAIQSLESAKLALEQGTSIWIAPEGTRGPGGKLLPFKQGGFHLAMSTGARILPVSIDGTGRVLAAHGRTVTEGVEVRVVVSEPIPTLAYAPERRDELVARVRRAIAENVASLVDKS
ncbi:MAG TPA: lysophospholipid acyltransferase family protein [Polyangiales bacterium]|nr:lysophospholipid acyltransferase family protein [Polyangiales bacterium]